MVCLAATLLGALCPDSISNITAVGVGVCHGDQPTGLSASVATRRHIKNTNGAFVGVKQRSGQVVPMTSSSTNYLYGRWPTTRRRSPRRQRDGDEPWRFFYRRDRRDTQPPHPHTPDPHRGDFGGCFSGVADGWYFRAAVAPASADSGRDTTSRSRHSSNLSGESRAPAT